MEHKFNSQFLGNDEAVKCCGNQLNTFIVESATDVECVKDANVVATKILNLSEDVCAVDAMIDKLRSKILSNDDKKDTKRSYYLFAQGGLKTIYRMCEIPLARITDLNGINETSIKIFKSLYKSLYDEFGEILSRLCEDDFNCDGCAYDYVFTSLNMQPQTKLLREFCTGNFNYYNYR